MHPSVRTPFGSDECEKKEDSKERGMDVQGQASIHFLSHNLWRRRNPVKTRCPSRSVPAGSAGKADTPGHGEPSGGANFIDTYEGPFKLG